MSKTHKFVKQPSNEQIKHRPIYSKTEQIDSKSKVQTRMMVTHRGISR